jgi:hypothetical protein
MAFDWFLTAAAALGVLSGATATVVGFGIGSLLTPFFAVPLGMSQAVALVTLPHLCATALRCVRHRRDIDRTVLARFGLLSACGGLGGALVYARLGQTALTGVLGALLVLTAIANLTGVFTRRSGRASATPHGIWVPALGLLSGLFGGLAGNQGGLRSAALAALPLSPRAFIATSTATGLLVDLARTPVYAAVSLDALLGAWRLVAAATLGVLAGTIVGERLLFGMAPATFRRILAGAVGALGVWLLARAL